jgi:hypothetical protein
MNTQNVKTAASESTERWGANPIARLACVIAEQKSYLNELCGLWNLQMPEEDEAIEIDRLLRCMSNNVLDEGVISWHVSGPLLSYPVLQPWLQAKAQAERLYGETGRTLWKSAHKELKRNMLAAIAMYREDIY